MLPRSPAETAIKAMVIEGEATVVVRERLEYQRLDVVDDGYVERIRMTCIPPAAFSPRDRTHQPSQRFLIEHGIRTWFADDADLVLARALLEHGRAREIGETLILSAAPVTWICSMLERMGLPLTTRALALYRHYFFDTDRLDEHALCEFFIRRGAGNSRFLKLAARLRGNSLSLLMTLLRLGRLPSGMSVELPRILSATRVAASIGALDATLSGDPRAAERYAGVAKSMCEIIEAVGDPEGDVGHQLHTLLLQTNSEGVPHIDALGEHTVNVEPNSVVAGADDADS